MAMQAARSVDEQDRQARDHGQHADERHPALAPIADALAQAGQGGFGALLDAVLDALFSDEVRAHVQQQAEQGLQESLDAVVEAIADSGAGRQLARELEQIRRQLHAVLAETLDSLFTGSVRAEFRQHLEEAGHALLQGDVTAATLHGKQTLQALLDAILHVLQHHWGQVLRLLIRVLANALQETLAAEVEEGLAGVATKPKKAAEEKSRSLQEQVKEKSDDLRQHLEEARDEMKRRLEEAKGKLQDRIESGASSAIKEGSRGRSQLGRPPSRRPPAGPSGRHPTGRSPLGRPPKISR